MYRLHIDLETFSSVDIKKAGLYKYVQSPDFQVLLLAYALDDQPVRVIDLMELEEHPVMSRQELQNVLNALSRPDIIKYAYNAAFEWYCLSKYTGQQMPLDQWRCTMVHGLYCGYPAGLAAVGEALGLGADKRKMWQGSSLIRTFCVPCKPTKTNGGRTRTLPGHEPEKWQLFKRYCGQDVETEREVERRLSPWPVPKREWKLWQLDMAMNALGVQVDRDMVNGAITCGNEITQSLMQEAVALSGIDNPKSVAQLKKWLEDETGEEMTDLSKEAVSAMVKTTTDDTVRRVLEIRQELGKTSVKKYDAMAAAMGGDDRVRGLLQFYGANRTGRWAGRLVQVQNLPRNYLATLDFARELVQGRKLEAMRLCYGNVPDTLSQLIRTAFIPAEGHTFVVADFSAIEARVIAWLAQEQWRMDVFATHGKIYEASASAMFGVPLEKIKKSEPEYALRQKGKVAELALGYGGSTGALIAMGALKQGLTEDELPDIVQRWRSSSPNIVRLWREVEACALHTVRTGQATGCHGLVFSMKGDYEKNMAFLTIGLPSGRELFYAQPAITTNKFDRDALAYRGVNQQTRKWETTETFGGKLVENIVQAIARDCLAETLLRLDDVGLKTVFHVHDEVIIESREECLEQALAMMAEPMPWAPGLLLKGDGFTCQYYRKD